MDLHGITAVLTPRSRAELAGWIEGDGFLAGGTWLFSEPQPAVRRLVDLTSLAWPALRADAAGLEIAATCRIAELHAWTPPLEWRAASLIPLCCDALLGSFKIWNAATVGGNICLALPAGPMTALAAALNGVCTIWTPDGERRIALVDFVVGNQRNALAAGEVLRSVFLPAEALRRRVAFRQMSLSPMGRSAALLIGTRGPGGEFALTLTASTPRPVRLDFPAMPTGTALPDAILAKVAACGWFDDVHGAPDWRCHVSLRLAGEILRELGTAA